MTEPKLSRRDFLKAAAGVIGGLAVAEVVGTNADAKELSTVENLIGQMDQHSVLWVTQEGLPYSFQAGKGHLFNAVAIYDEKRDVSEGRSRKGMLGFAHGDHAGAEVDGFRMYPDPAHPESFLYFPELPRNISPGIIQSED